MEFQVRKATKNDMPSVLKLINELAVYEREPDAVEVTVADLERDGFGDQALFNCFVAENPNESIVSLYKLVIIVSIFYTCFIAVRKINNGFIFICQIIN